MEVALWLSRLVDFYVSASAEFLADLIVSSVFHANIRIKKE